MTKFQLYRNKFNIDLGSLTAVQRYDITKDLTVEGNSNYNFSRTVKDYSFKGNILQIPKYYGIKKFNINNYTDEHVYDTVDYNFLFSLRDKQQQIADKTIDYLNSYHGGTLVLPCGFGKTIIALYIISRLKLKTLIIINKQFLLDQWKDKCKEFLGINDIGIIRQDIIEIKNITIGMLQSIIREDKYSEDVFNNFDFVIYDEAHHMPSESFSKAIPVTMRHKSLALTATPVRKDGLQSILYWNVGYIIHKEQTKTLSLQVSLIKFNIEHEKYKELYLYNGNVNRAKVLNNITTIGRRNIMICNIIKDILTDKNRKIILLSDRINHLELLERRLNKDNIFPSYYVGNMKPKELKEAESNRIILASYSMASEGLDIPALNTLILATPRREIEQSVGRITRGISMSAQNTIGQVNPATIDQVNPATIDQVNPATIGQVNPATIGQVNPATIGQVNPTVYDIIDELPCFLSQSYGRNRIYSRLGCNNFNHFTVDADKFTLLSADNV